LIEEIDDDVRTYLSAVGALAIYVAEQDRVPVRVGFCHDPRRALTYLARRWPRASFGWMAWFEDGKMQAASFVAEILENSGELLALGQPHNRLAVVERIESIAKLESVTLTPHKNAVERAQAYTRRLDGALATLQQGGHFGSFNHAYRIYRERQRLKGESALPYWAAKEQMRQTIILWLVQHQRIDPAALLTEIRERFPWFKTYGRLHVAGKKAPRN